MPLTDTEIRNAKPGAKPTKMSDGGGLLLLVTPAGGKNLFTISLKGALRR